MLAHLCIIRLTCTNVDTDTSLLGGFIQTALNVSDKIISRTRLWIDVIDSGASCSMVQNDERLLGRISKLLGFKVGIQMGKGQCDSTSAGILVVHTPRNAHNIVDGVYTDYKLSLVVPSFEKSNMALHSTTQGKKSGTNRPWFRAMPSV